MNSKFTERRVKTKLSILGSKTATDWYELDFGEAKNISTVKVFLISVHKRYRVPSDLSVDYRIGSQWVPVTGSKTTAKLIGNTVVNTVSFHTFITKRIIVLFKHRLNGTVVEMTELECY